jgi:hypothetical protein
MSKTSRGSGRLVLSRFGEPLCVAPVAPAPHCEVWRPWRRHHTNRVAKTAKSWRIVLQYVLCKHNRMCGALATGATIHCVAPIPRAPHMSIYMTKTSRGSGRLVLTSFGEPDCVAPLASAPHSRGIDATQTGSPKRLSPWRIVYSMFRAIMLLCAAPHIDLGIKIKKTDLAWLQSDYSHQ